ncbi:D-amino-acid oxidase [Lecanosticta acicola]|uniref:D-amino-acid oxidase n=1 Tax=Lecanosticta acicola TaxID=111012 RepID=A0AAI8Z4A8_9PEZI|nr:D-amino-acid oxidase [Lecanosticta acicola]
MASRPHVVVIGAGVIGLTNAVWLAEAGYTVTIIAAHVPGDESIEYTSPWAGAHWRTHATVDEPEQCDWDVQTFKYWEELLEREARDDGLPRSGLKMQESIHYWDSAHIHEDLWWAVHVKNFKQLSLLRDPILSINRDSPPHAPRIRWGATSRACSVNVPRYLVYLQERARASGAILFQSRLPTDGGLEKALTTAEGISKILGRGGVDVFVNATGLGARAICGDEGMVPIRGQTVLVKGEASATRTRYHGGGEISRGMSSYVIPRPGSGTTILGGTKERGEWSGETDAEVIGSILERCSWMAPELLTGEDGGFEVVSAQAGLRPGREGGPRVEREVVGDWKVVHSYGNAGGGYQNSVGVARKVLRLVEESIGGGVMSAKL